MDTVLYSEIGSTRTCTHTHTHTQHDAYRARLLAVGGNTIDCMFVDKRGSPDVTAKGNKVVICCEGNAAFYELGMMEIPLSRECVCVCLLF